MNAGGDLKNDLARGWTSRIMDATFIKDAADPVSSFINENIFKTLGINLRRRLSTAEVGEQAPTSLGDTSKAQIFSSPRVFDDLVWHISSWYHSIGATTIENSHERKLANSGSSYGYSSYSGSGSKYGSHDWTCKTGFQISYRHQQYESHKPSYYSQMYTDQWYNTDTREKCQSWAKAKGATAIQFDPDSSCRGFLSINNWNHSSLYNYQWSQNQVCIDLNPDPEVKPECGRRCQRYSDNGYCDDECNIEACNYDGGDCKTNGEKVHEVLSSLIPVGSGEKVTTPATCSYGNYQAKDECFVKYTGLGSLIGAPLDMTININRCTDPKMSEAFPAVAFGMSGSFVEAIKNPTPCSTSSDCSVLGSDFECTDFGSMLGKDDRRARTLEEEGDGECSEKCQRWSGDDYCDEECNIEACNNDGGDCEKSDGEKLMDLIHQMLELVLYKPDTDTGTCLADDKLFKHVRSLVLALAGKPKDDSSSLKFCTPNIDQLADSISDNFDAWTKKAELSKDGDTWEIPFLVDGETMWPKATPPGNPTSFPTLSPTPLPT
jgi:hypothetical protein